MPRRSDIVRRRTWWGLALIASVVLASGCRRHDEEPPDPACTRAPDGSTTDPSCPVGYTVTCTAEKPYPVCVYDVDETEGVDRCAGEIGENLFPPYSTPTCEPEE